MEVLPRAIATSSVVVSASSVAKESSGSINKKVQVSVPSVPFLRPAAALAASIVASASPAALAVNYDDFVRRATESVSPAASDLSFPSLPSIELPSVNFPSVDFDGATDFVSANPLALVVGLVAITVPFIATRAFAGPGASFGSVSAVEAYDKLSNPEVNAQLLDIRELEDIKAEGNPNLKSIKKTAVKVAYSGDDDIFVDKVSAKFKDAENTTLYILDRFDGSTANVAKLLANSGFKSAYAIKGGAEGQNGWNEKELPWSAPPKAFKLDIGNLKNIIGDSEGLDVDGAGLLPTTLGVAAAAGVGFVVLSEAETTLQLLGTVAVLQLFVKKFLFAEERKKTVQEIKSFLETKIAPQSLVEDVKDVGRVLLPKEGEVKAAVATGEKVLEKELGVDSVTPGALAEKAKEKIVEEAEKLGVEIPDLKEVQSDIESNVELVTSDLKSGAKELQSNIEEVSSDLKSGAEDFKSNAEDAVSEAESKAKEVTSDLKTKAEEAKSNLESGAEEAKSAVESGAEEAKSAVESTAEKATKSSNGSATPAVEEEKPPGLPVLQEPPSLTPKAEVETPVSEAVEPSTTAAKVEEVTPFFESDADVKPSSPFENVAAAVSSEGNPDAAIAAFEGDEPPALAEGGVGEDITAKKLEELTASSRADSSS